VNQAIWLGRFRFSAAGKGKEDDDKANIA
jgi:hypothetical protein